jgi:quercetin dioxygenase-like cupin family protein
MSLNRPLSGQPLIVNLDAIEAGARSEHREGYAGRYARTLVKDGRLRVTMIALEKGSAIPEHRAEGPITVQVLNGSIRFTTNGSEHRLDRGALLSLAANVPHSVAADEDAAFLLTVSLAGE